MSTKLVKLKRGGGKRATETTPEIPNRIIQGCSPGGYIGRACNMGGWNLPRSPFANPYPTKISGSHEASVRLYIDHIYREGLVYKIEKLRGLTLGCWCKPKPCHGDILLAFLHLTKRRKVRSRVILTIPNIEELKEYMNSTD